MTGRRPLSSCKRHLGVGFMAYFRLSRPTFLDQSHFHPRKSFTLDIGTDSYLDCAPTSIVFEQQQKLIRGCLGPDLPFLPDSCNHISFNSAKPSNHGPQNYTLVSTTSWGFNCWWEINHYCWPEGAEGWPMAELSPWRRQSNQPYGW